MVNDSSKIDAFSWTHSRFYQIVGECFHDTGVQLNHWDCYNFQEALLALLEMAEPRAVLEAAIRTKAGGTCPEEIKIPSTPGVQLKPEWFEA